MKTKMPPECALHGPMEQRPVERQTKEQQWCGEWWDCAKCGSSDLQPSLDLEKQLAEQRLELFDNGDVKWKLTDRERGWYDVIVGRFKIGQVARPGDFNESVSWQGYDMRGKNVANSQTRREASRRILRFGSSFPNSDIPVGIDTVLA